MNKKKIIIIGGVAAGTKTAAKLKRLRPEFCIDLFTQDEYISYSACGLPYYIKGDVDKIEKILIRSPQEFAEQGINIHLKHKCIKIIPEKKIVIIKNLDKNINETVKYDKLVLATGAKPFLPPVKNIHYKNIYTLRNITDALKIKKKMTESKTVTIIGGNTTAIELLEAFVHNGLNVTLITDSMYVMKSYDMDIAKYIQETILNISGEKVKIITSDSVIAFEGKKEFATKTVTMKGLEIESDFVVLCTGIYPDTNLAVEAGLDTGVKHAIRVNSSMQTSDKDIYAVGDCCEKTGLVTKTKLFVGLGTIANKEARTVAINLAGYKDTFLGILLSTTTKYFDFNISKVGLTEITSLERGYKIISATVTKKDRAGYMPKVEYITLKLIADATDGKILGAQAVGKGDTDKRIWAVATAIQGQLTVKDIVNADLPYSPPFSSVVDILHVCAIKLDEQLKNTNS